MNDVAAVARRHEEEVDLGHPVRSFTAVMVILGLLLLAVQWTGVVQPRLTSPSGGSSESATEQRFAIHLRNDSGLAVRVTDARWPSEDMEVAVLALGAAGDPGVPGRPTAPFAPFRLGAGESRVVSITVVPRCFATLGDLEVDVRTAIGVTRTLRFDPPEREVHGGC